jgi:DNA processing protein
MFRGEEYLEAACRFPGDSGKGWAWLYEEAKPAELTFGRTPYRGVDFGQKLYPGGLRGLKHPPPFLFSRGELPVDRKTIGIVGARATDGYGSMVAHHLGRVLAEAGCVIVSGGARGIDASAHQGVVDGQGRGIVVLAGGLDHLSPRSSQQIFQGILQQGGALVSEVPDFAKAKKHNFLQRNRIIAALSDVLVVVSARRRSGSLATARWANQLGKPVFAVPGDLHYSLSEGVNHLVGTGHATLLHHPDQLLQELDKPNASRVKWPQPKEQRRVSPGVQWTQGVVSPRANIPLSGQELQIQRLALNDPVDATLISEGLGLSMVEATSRLELMLLRGHLRRFPGNAYILSSPIQI